MNLFVQLAITKWRNKFKYFLKDIKCDCKVCKYKHNINMTKKQRTIWIIIVLITSVVVGIVGGIQLS